ncbi:MAG TPA: ATP-binding protein [Polyangiaceae bacterium]|nr:ATP-binding protein [Polyangiaceae bacterium]
MVAEAPRSALGERAKQVSALAAITVVVTACSTLAGWIFALPMLTSVLPGRATMKVNTAICFVVCGLGLYAHAAMKDGKAARFSRWLPLIALATATVTALEHATGWNAGIDVSFSAELASPSAGGAAGRMAPATAIGFVLTASALLLLNGRHRAAIWPSQWLALTCEAVFLATTLGYLFGAASLYSTPGFGSVALHTALLFQVVSMGLLLARPYSGLMRPLTAELTAADAARKLLPAVVVVPIMLGWMHLEGQRRGFYGTEFGLAIYATSNVMVLVALTWRTSAILGRAEREQLRMKQALAESEELRRRTKELEEQNLRIEEANRHKSQFLANMSHELRTPLNAVIGFAGVLRSEKAGPLNAVQKEHLSEVLSGGRHLLGLINDILDLTKVESGVLSFEAQPVDLQRLASDVLDTVGGLAREKDVELRADISESLPIVQSDPKVLKQILFNYLSNALKFTRESGHVTLHILEEGDQDFRIDVEDDGIGIKREDLPRLFVEFQQLDSGPAKRYPGTGLGLAITKRLAETLGGRVEVESVFGRGSLFSAVLPRKLVAAETSEVANGG